MKNRIFFKNIGIVSVRLIAGAILGIFSSSYIARMLGPSNNGVYALVVLIPALAIAFGGFGLASSVVYIMGKRQYSQPEVLAKLILVSSLISLMIVCALLVLPLDIFGAWMPNVPQYMIITGISLIPVFFLYTNLNAIFHGQQNFQRYGLISLLPIVLTVSFLICIPNGSDKKLPLSVAAWGAGYLITLVFMLWLMRLELGDFLKYARSSSGLLREAFRFGLKSYAGNLISFINYRLNFYLLGTLVGADAVGIYAVTIPITEGVWMFATAVATVIFPLIANSSTNKGQVENPTPTACRWVFIASCMAGLLIASFVTFIVENVFGTAYMAAAQAILWLLPGVILFSVTKVLSSDIAGRGRPDLNLYVTALALIINIATCYLLLPRFGLNGAAMAVSITYGFYTVIISVIYSRLVDVRVLELFLPGKRDFQMAKRISEEIIFNIKLR